MNRENEFLLCLGNGKSLIEIENEEGYYVNYKSKKHFIPNRLGKRNINYKGDLATKQAIHSWVKIRKEKPKYCEICNIKPPIDLANISQKYKRDINDYKWLCRSCHVKFDYTIYVRKHKKPTTIKEGDMYRCNSCLEYKSKNEFHKSKSGYYNIRQPCAICRNKLDRDKYKTTNSGQLNINTGQGERLI